MCLKSVGYLFLYVCIGLASEKDISFASPISRSCQCSSEDLLEKIIKKISIEPVHEISNNAVCATSKDSDQPAHTRSLIRAFASRLGTL